MLDLKVILTQGVDPNQATPLRQALLDRGHEVEVDAHTTRDVDAGVVISALGLLVAVIDFYCSWQRDKQGQWTNERSLSVIQAALLDHGVTEYELDRSFDLTKFLAGGSSFHVHLTDIATGKRFKITVFRDGQCVVVSAEAAE